jgi:hypothetical protein
VSGSFKVSRIAAALGLLCVSYLARSASAPPWMHALVNVALPEHNEKTTAVLLYSDISLIVAPGGKVKRLERRAYKILRPEGQGRGRAAFFVDGKTRITELHAWCIPAVGKDYEVKQRDAVEASIDSPNGVLVSDIHVVSLQIPAALPDNIVGYEVEEELTPTVLADAWSFQDLIPVREAHYSVQLPSNWSYQATWLNHAEVVASSAGANKWQWTLSDVPALRVEPHMPALGGIAGRMFVAWIAPRGQGQSIQSWADLGTWYSGLAAGRRSASPELKQKVIELTAASPTLLAKMQALARFAQDDIRYVAIELGIGGYQPHSAAEVFAHRFGDCKDKATLMSAMLAEIGVSSYYVLINTQRGAVTGATPPNTYFNHMILAVALPADLNDPSLEAIHQHPKLGRLLFFDPTNPLTPFGGLLGPLQANYGMLVTPDGGELTELPQLPASSNGIARTATLTLDEQGTLRGEVNEVRLGLRAAEQRNALRNVRADTDQIRPVEALLAATLPSFQITKASVANLRAPDKPFEWRYSIEADHYARSAGELLLVRPRVIGSKTQGFLETKEPRRYPIEFDEPERDTDVFEINVPPGYVVDQLPAPIDVDGDFASYHSKTELIGRTLRYTRSYEISKLTVPADRAGDLKSLYRAIEADERGAAVLKHPQP